MKYYYSKSRKKPNVKTAIEGYSSFYARNWRKFFLSSGNLQKNPISLCASLGGKIEKKEKRIKKNIAVLSSATKLENITEKKTKTAAQKLQKDNINVEQNKIWKTVLNKEVPAKNQDIRMGSYLNGGLRSETERSKKIESSSNIIKTNIIKDIKRKEAGKMSAEYYNHMIKKDILHKERFVKEVMDKRETAQPAKMTNSRKNGEEVNTTKNVDKKDSIYKLLYPKEETAQTNLYRGCVKCGGWGERPFITSNKQTNRNVANPMAAPPFDFCAKLLVKEPMVESIISTKEQNEKIKNSKNPPSLLITHKKQKIIFPKISSAAAGVL